MNQSIPVKVKTSWRIKTPDGTLFGFYITRAQAQHACNIVRIGPITYRVGSKIVLPANSKENLPKQDAEIVEIKRTGQYDATLGVCIIEEDGEPGGAGLVEVVVLNGKVQS